jgi:hypothetical protein
MKSIQWRPAEQIARKVEQEVQKQVGEAVIQMADKWISENKLIHAGAAQKLADMLKKLSTTETAQEKQ